MSDSMMGPKEVARATGVSTDTLRHYEREGLLPRVRRTAAGYREYSAATVQRVLLIQRALVIGFSLAALKRVLTVRDRGGAPCRNVRDLIDERLQALDRRIDELLALRDELRGILPEWDDRLSRTPRGQPAHLLESLDSKPHIESVRRARRLGSTRASLSSKP
jgi:DNA-binding transcriptional MerR regulator